MWKHTDFAVSYAVPSVSPVYSLSLLGIVLAHPLEFRVVIPPLGSSLRWHQPSQAELNTSLLSLSSYAEADLRLPFTCLSVHFSISAQAQCFIHPATLALGTKYLVT